MGWIVSFSNPYVDTLTPNVTVFSDRASKELIKIKEGHNWCPYKTGKEETLEPSPSQCAQRIGPGGPREKVAIYKPGRKVSPETNPDGALTFNF